MSCKSINSIEEAEEPITASLFPTSGLRRGTDGALTLDAVRTIVDGLKSRGIDPKDPATKRELLRQMEMLFCTVNNQYQFLVDDMMKNMASSQPVSARRLQITIEKNQYMLDILTVLRHIQSMQIHDQSTVFIEAWQNPLQTAASGLSPNESQLKDEKDLLESRNLYEIRKHRVDILEEKNRVATNYIGLYGFLNLVAVGLLIYSTQGGYSTE